MRIKLKTLRKIIQESISQAQLQNLQPSIESGDEENYNQAIELWDTLDPGGCPYPPYEEFWGNGQPLVMDIFSRSIMSMQDPAFFREHCSAEWLSPKHELKFEFSFPFVCVDEDEWWDSGEGEQYYVVPETDSYTAEDWIKKEIASEIFELSHHREEIFWNKWKSIDVYIDGDHLQKLGNGHATVTVSYT